MARPVQPAECRACAVCGDVFKNTAQGLCLGFIVLAHEAGIFLAPLSRYTIESPRRGWLFGYAGYDTATLRAAASTLWSLLPTLGTLAAPG